MWYEVASIIETQELVEKLTEEHRALFEAGEVVVSEGQDYPVVRQAHGQNRGRLVKGTGLPVRHPDISNKGTGLARSTGWKHTNAYRELLEKIIPASEDTGKRGTLGWLVNQGFSAAEGGDVYKEVGCPECGHSWQQKVWKKPDSNAIIKMMEMVVGKAPEQKDINVRAEQIYRLIDERHDIKDIEVFEIDPGEAQRRHEALKEAEWEADN